MGTPTSFKKMTKENIQNASQLSIPNNNVWEEF